MTVEYRHAKPSDLGALLPLVEAYAQEQQGQMPVNTLSKQYMDFVKAGIGEALQNSAGCVLLAEATEGDKTELVGYAIGMVQEPPQVFEPELYVFISDLYVSPQYRRRGIGTSLAERVRGWGWVKGINRFSLVVPIGSPLERIFEKIGFKPIQTMLYYKDQV